MRPHHVSASRTELLLACPYWAHPSVEHAPTGSDEAAAGTDNHAVLADAAKGLDAPDWARSAVFDVPNDAQIEVTMALDVDTGVGRPLGTEARGYDGISKNDIPGTVDAAWFESGTLYVRDWKTGDSAREHTTPARDNAQLAVLALAMCGYFVGIERVVLQLGFVGPGRELELDEHETTPAELRERWLELLRRALNDALEVTSAPRPNSGCGWCPALRVCPVARGQLATVERAAAMTENAILTTAIESPEHAASVYLRLKLVDKLSEQIGAALKAYVQEHGPAPLGDGKILRISESTSERCSLSKCTKEQVEALRAAGAVSVSMSSRLIVGSAEPRKRTKKEKAQ